MSRFRKRIFIIFAAFNLIGLAGPSICFATEFFRFFDKSCQQTTGQILDIDETSIYMLRVDGGFESLPRSQVKGILVYRTIQNPIQNIQLSQNLHSYLKDIYLIQKDEVAITGWITQFIDDLIVVYDTKGKTHVIEFQQIDKIRPATIKIDTTLNLNRVKMAFSNGDYEFCTNGNKDGDLKPARILIDPIHIGEFFSNFEQGFLRVQGLESRTYFYARPYIFEKSTRLGLVSLDSMEQPLKSFPFYFQWSTGQPYRFQSLTALGGYPAPISTSLVNPFLVYSEVKSYFFHASFAGNLAALPAGNDFYSLVTLDPNVRNKNFFASSFNYMALMGIDYGRFSVSFGNFYPLFFFNYKDLFFREVLSNSVSPVLRLRYMGSSWSSSFLYSQTSSSIANPTDDHISLSPNFSTIGMLTSFEFKSKFFRLDLDYKFSDKIKITTGGLYQMASYSETHVSEGNNSNRSNNIILYLMPEIDVGRYVSVKGMFSLYKADRRFNLAGEDLKDQDNRFVMGGILEFIF